MNFRSIGAVSVETKGPTTGQFVEILLAQNCVQNDRAVSDLIDPACEG